jgi:PmbA protein
LLVSLDEGEHTAYEPMRCASIQLRTVLQHAWAEFEHEIRYKGTVPSEHASDLDRRFTLAAGLLGAFVQAVSGGALYRKASFLLDSLGERVLAGHVDVDEDPHQPKGKGSAPFDDEGVHTRARRIVDAGVVKSYFLSSYSARKLGLHTTGHAGGAHNLRMTSRLTQPGDDLDAMLRRLGRGLFVTELMGQGVNGVTGDYSRGAAGYWVEGGQIAHPVHEVTVAGNLREMLRDIAAIGADAYTQGSRTAGSVLVSHMKLAGA